MLYIVIYKVKLENYKLRVVNIFSTCWYTCMICSF